MLTVKQCMSVLSAMAFLFCTCALFLIHHIVSNACSALGLKRSVTIANVLVHHAKLVKAEPFTRQHTTVACNSYQYHASFGKALAPLRQQLHVGCSVDVSSFKFQV